MTCATPSNTRIFASDFQFGEFRAILRGVFVKKIHIFPLVQKYFVPLLFEVGAGPVPARLPIRANYFLL
jgi:hypothetical protein